MFFFILFLNFLLYCFYNVVMEMDIVKYSLDDIFLFFFLIFEIGYSNLFLLAIWFQKLYAASGGNNNLELYDLC
jgi:hypothetical protein